MEKILQFLFRLLPAILLIAVIFLASATPDYDLPSFGLLDLLVKKGGHMTGYFLLTLAFIRATGNTNKKSLFLALVLSLLYSISDEFHQSFVPGRHPAATDVLIDMTGGLLAAWAVSRFTGVRRWVFAGMEA